MWDYKTTNAKRATGGYILDNQSGKTYRSEINLSGNDTLRVTGKLFIFSRTQTWRRLKQRQVQSICKQPSFVCLNPCSYATNTRPNKMS